jgi:hypothetical protein
MSTMTVLETLKAFLEAKVTPTIKLQKAENDNVQSYELVNPAVHIGWLPPNGYLPEGMESAIPCLIVGMDEATKDDSDVDYNIRISAAVYSPGLHVPVEKELNYSPDFQGYWDLLNLIDRTVIKLGENPIINSKVTIKDPVKWGMYQEQPYPYWYGWITLPLAKLAVQPAEICRNLL